MSSVLRLFGSQLDVDALLASTSMQPIAVFRKGEPQFQRKPNGPVRKSSGANFSVSAEEMGNVSAQVQETLVFVQSRQEALRALATFPGVEGAVIDIGAAIHPPGWSSFTFPHELLAVLGRCGVNLEISVYPVEEPPEP